MLRTYLPPLPPPLPHLLSLAVCLKETIWLMVFCIVFSGEINPNNTHMSHGNADQMAINAINPINASMTMPLRMPDDEMHVNHIAHINRIECNDYKQHRPTSTEPLNLTNATIPTTIDDLIECIALHGDQHEEIIKHQIAQMNERTLFR